MVVAALLETAQRANNTETASGRNNLAFMGNRPFGFYTNIITRKDRKSRRFGAEGQGIAALKTVRPDRAGRLQETRKRRADGARLRGTANLLPNERQRQRPHVERGKFRPAFAKASAGTQAQGDNRGGKWAGDCGGRAGARSTRSQGAWGLNGRRLKPAATRSVGETTATPMTESGRDGVHARQIRRLQLSKSDIFAGRGGAGRV